MSESERPRYRLERSMIVEAALRLANQRGVGSISVRELGVILDATPTAIYRHFSDKRELMEQLLDELLRQAAEKAQDLDGGWQERLRTLANAIVDTLRQYPAVGMEATVLTTHGRGELAVIETILQTLSEAGLSGSRLVQYYGLVSSHVLTHAAGAARVAGTATGEAPRVGLWLEGPLHPADPVETPMVLQTGPELAVLTDDGIFQLGLDLIIQCAEQESRSDLVRDARAIAN